MAIDVGGSVVAKPNDSDVRDDLAGSLAELVSRHLCGPVADALQAAATVARTAITAWAAAVNVQRHTRAGAAFEFAATDPVALRLQELQSRCGSGLAALAAENSRAVAVIDIMDPHWQVGDTKVLLKHGVRTVLAVPVPGPTGAAGSICAYDTEPRHWTSTEVATAAAVARIVGALLENAAARERQDILVAQLQHALDSRVVIEQAKGVLAEREGVMPDEAFEGLRNYARSNQLKVRDLAADVVAGRATVPPSPDRR